MDKYPVLITAIIQILLVVITVWVNLQPGQKPDVTDESEIGLSLSQAEGEVGFQEEEEPAWGFLAEYPNTPYERMVAIEKGLSADPDRQTKGSLIIIKALVLNEQGKTRQAIETLHPVLFDENTTSINFMEAEFELSRLENRQACPIIYEV